MNKKFVYPTLGLLMLTSVAIAQEKPFTIKGTIKGKTEGYVYLGYRGHGYDSSRIENGHFSFAGNLAGPTQGSFTTDIQNRLASNYLPLYLVPGKMKLFLDNNDLDASVLKGSKVQDEANRLKRSKEGITTQLKPLIDAYSAANKTYSDAVKAKKDEATLARLKDEAEDAKEAMGPLQKQLGEMDSKFMDEHPQSFVTATMLRYRISGMSVNEAEERYGKLPEQIKNSELGKGIKTEVEGLRMGSPGSAAFQFASKELRGEDLKLADYKGKYVLLDFWASWCVPCRRGNPHLLALYAKYKDKGFEIIGVSDDDGKPEAWQKAVEQDKIGVWKHVLRGLKRVDGPAMFDRSNSISDRYGIHTLPTKILIDPNGMIIGRYGGGGENDEAMDKKFSEIFNGQLANNSKK